MPILTTNNDPSKRFTAEDARLLREECDDVMTYREAGWFCVIGYKGDRRLVHGHCDSQEQYERMMGISTGNEFESTYNPWDR